MRNERRPFGFCELFDPRSQAWIGGGELSAPVSPEPNLLSYVTPGALLGGTA